MSGGQGGVQGRAFELHIDVADFVAMASAVFTIAREMGRNMERTARAPVYSVAHDFVTSIVTTQGELVALAEYIPVLSGVTPPSVNAVQSFFDGDIHQGDVYLVNDPYTMDAGSQLADWGIVCPVFWKERHVLWIANKAHQQDTGGGMPGSYNPGALDIYGEGLRIPPVRLFNRGSECRDVFNFIMANVRSPAVQRGDLLSMIGAARVGERRLKALYDLYGEQTVRRFIVDLLGYGEGLMREQIAKLPDGAYHSEVTGAAGASPIVCDLTIQGDEVTVDLSGSGPQVEQYVNSPIANTTSAVHVALMTSVGKKIAYRCGGCYRPLHMVTRPGTIVHPLPPATQGNCTNFCAKQIIEVVWDALAQASPCDTPAGWGSVNYWVMLGVDPRRGEGYGSPDFLACSSGAGAIWGVDGWSANGPTICSGTLYYPEIEILEGTYPILWERWQLAIDSGGPGRWRGGLGVDNMWVVDSAPERLVVAYAADPYDYQVAPAVAGGQPPKPNCKTLCYAGGRFENQEEVRAKMLYELHSGDRVIDYTQGGAGVGDPFARDVMAVQADVRDELVSLESARDDYGVVLDHVTLEMDAEATAALRGRKTARP